MIMTARKNSVGDYDLIFDEGRKIIRGMHFVGPCDPETIEEKMRHENCTGHMYQLSKKDFQRIYRIVNGNMPTGLKIGILGRIATGLQKEPYLGIASEVDN